VIGALLQHARIARQFARIGVVRKAQFKVEFWFQVAMDFFWYATHVATFEFLYRQVDTIAGWDRAEFRVLLGYLFVSDAFMMVWLGQMSRFGRDVKDGALDPVRVRPAATLFVYAFQQFSLEGCVNMVMACAYLGYAVGIAPGFSAASSLALLLGIALCFWVRVVVVTLFSIGELWLLGSEVGSFLKDLLYSTTDRPVDVFGTRLRLFLLYIVPVGALTQVPASIVLGHYSAIEAAGACAWLVALGLAVIAAWNRSLRRYESARG
jgi:ABC-2 type transport system permease protein